jgi:hypothetical protein
MSASLPTHAASDPYYGFDAAWVLSSSSLCLYTGGHLFAGMPNTPRR